MDSINSSQNFYKFLYISLIIIVVSFYFQELIDVNQGLLKTIGVSHPSLDLVQEITAKQKLHSKLTGAGGGGFAFALVTPNHGVEQIQAAKKELLQNGFECWEAQIGCHGIILEEANSN